MDEVNTIANVPSHKPRKICMGFWVPAILNLDFNLWTYYSFYINLFRHPISVKFDSLSIISRHRLHIRGFFGCIGPTHHIKKGIMDGVNFTIKCSIPPCQEKRAWVFVPARKLQIFQPCLERHVQVLIPIGNTNFPVTRKKSCTCSYNICFSDFMFNYCTYVLQEMMQNWQGNIFQEGIEHK